MLPRATRGGEKDQAFCSEEIPDRGSTSHQASLSSLTVLTVKLHRHRLLCPSSQLSPELQPATPSLETLMLDQLSCINPADRSTALVQRRSIVDSCSQPLQFGPSPSFLSTCKARVMTSLLWKSRPAHRLDPQDPDTSNSKG